MWNFTHSSLDYFWTDVANNFFFFIWVLLVLILSWDWKNGRIFYKHITKHFVFILPHRIRVGFSSPNNDVMNSSNSVDCWFKPKCSRLRTCWTLKNQNTNCLNLLDHESKLNFKPQKLAKKWPNPKKVKLESESVSVHPIIDSYETAIC